MSTSTGTRTGIVIGDGAGGREERRLSSSFWITKDLLSYVRALHSDSSDAHEEHFSSFDNLSSPLPQTHTNKAPINVKKILLTTLLFLRCSAPAIYLQRYLVYCGLG